VYSERHGPPGERLFVAPTRCAASCSDSRALAPGRATRSGWFVGTALDTHRPNFNCAALRARRQCRAPNCHYKPRLSGARVQRACNLSWQRSALLLTDCSTCRLRHRRLAHVVVEPARQASDAGPNRQAARRRPRGGCSARRFCDQARPCRASGRRVAPKCHNPAASQFPHPGECRELPPSASGTGRASGRPSQRRRVVVKMWAGRVVRRNALSRNRLVSHGCFGLKFVGAPQNQAPHRLADSH
jgi:hypothetical protein